MALVVTSGNKYIRSVLQLNMCFLHLLFSLRQENPNDLTLEGLW